MPDASKILRTLQPHQGVEMYRGAGGTIVSVTRTNKICLHDFAVGLKIPGRDEFYPTHIRLLFDLYLKRLSSDKNYNQFFCKLEKVYDEKDQELLAPDILKLSFPMKLDDPDINLYYAQLLMIEQDFNYGPQGVRSQGWVLLGSF